MPLKLLESAIQRTCEDILRAHQWRIFRLEENYSERKRKRVGERGAPDCMAVKYNGCLQTPPTGKAQIVHIEWKAAKGKPSEAQTAWHAAERARGAFTAISGIDFPASIEGFTLWAKRNGLIL